MSTTASALLGYALWTMLLAFAIVNMRGLLVLQGRKANTFQPDGADVSDFSQRLCRAYYNCTENLPAAGAILACAIATGHTALSDGLAMVVLGARVGQSVTHMISATHWAVMVRVSFYVVQLLTLAWIAIRLIGA